MGQLTLGRLVAVGNAVVRFMSWVSDPRSQDLEGAWPYLQALQEHAGDTLVVEEAGIVLAPQWQHVGGFSTEGGSHWRCVIALSEEVAHLRDDAEWYLAVEPTGVRGGLRVEPMVEFSLAEDEYFHSEFVLEAAGDKERSLVASEVLDDFRLTGQRKRTVRRLLRALDGYSRYPVVVVDLAWEAAPTRDSVMAQIVEWALRVREFGHSDVPELSDDALTWWSAWARQMNFPRGSDDDLSLGQLFEIVARTVRPDHPAGHRRYWKESLKATRRRGNLVAEAAGQAGMSRSWAYQLLRNAERSVSEFKRGDAPVRELAAWLRANGTSKRRLTEQQRQVIESLVDAGMKRNSARRLERRTRHLSPAERQRRLHGVLGHASSSRRRGHDRVEPTQDSDAAAQRF